MRLPGAEKLELHRWRKVTWLASESRLRELLELLLNHCKVIGNRFLLASIGPNSKNTPRLLSSVANEDSVNFQLLVP